MTNSSVGPQAAHLIEQSRDRKFRALINNASDIITILGSDGNIQYESPSVERVLGYAPEEMIGRNSFEFVHPDDTKKIKLAFAQVISGNMDGLGVEFRYLHKNGSWRTLELTGTNLLQDVDVEGIVVNSRDITERKRAEEGLRQSEERYALAMRGANDGLWDWDLQSQELYLSERWKSMLGYEDGEVSNRSQEWFSRIHPDDRELLEQAIRVHIEGQSNHFESEYRILHKSGAYLHMLCRGVAVRTADNKAVRMAGSQSDITDRKKAEERLRHDAFHDPLTDLPNRMLFIDRLNACLSRARRRKQYRFAVLFLDLDRFKIVNDSLGHGTGDRLLVQMGTLLRGCVRTEDTVSRLGGDEFTILIDDLDDPGSASRTAQRIQEALRQPFNFEGQEVFMSASIGIALSSPEYSHPDEIVRDADIAMYRAKGLGRARHELFDTSMHSHLMSQLQLETDLRRALERQEFEVWYQPIVSVESGKINGFEALARWRSPQRGIVSPAEFIPVAEETGLIVQVGLFILKEACAQLARWQKEFLDPSLTMSVNLSTRQFIQHDLVERIAEILNQGGIAPERLKLEITESAVMDDPVSAGHILQRIRKLGCKVCLDDFGTGYSSLSYLIKFPIDTLKIDRSFITGVDSDADRAEIVNTIIRLADNLQMDVVAEGVETAKQLSQLQMLKCGQAQGYLFSKPMQAKAASKMMEDQVSQGIV